MPAAGRDGTGSGVADTGGDARAADSEQSRAGEDGTRHERDQRANCSSVCTL